VTASWPASAPRSRGCQAAPLLGRVWAGPLQNRASLVGDTPAAVHPLDETLGEDIQVGHAGCQSLRAFGPVPSAGRQNRHIALEVRHRSEPVWIADQHLEDRHLEVHCPTRTRLPRTYFLDILGAFVNLCRLTAFIRWFSLEVRVGMVMAEDSSPGTVLVGVRNLGMVTSTMIGRLVLTQAGRICDRSMVRNPRKTRRSGR
jgi:hypothetical protein